MSVTPVAAGLRRFVDLGKSDFTGKAVLETADKRCRTWGPRVPDEIARLGESLWRDDRRQRLLGAVGKPPDHVAAYDPALGQAARQSGRRSSGPV